MSRKDPRRIVRVPLSAAAVSHLRAHARGRSLADALRRIAEMHDGPVPPAAPRPARHLPVQMPPRLRARMSEAAARDGRTSADMLAGIAEAAQARADPPGD
ncbi:hypothetical protein ROJ8625_00447 [Roseivivax jejudonensis]|uniref:Uncharacterized protein n=1 Tax=Roseivivax jejudonensis TaxID=1529041 RepID=A0A1X6Y9F9_9RHOB|nr:hypothetical protein [Roseivivax jejudonensis]SLN14136.1 hypothetical protein ROJ8625_00447 [Roseivivax jejudonensis]